MKAKEKGIDERSLRRGKDAEPTSTTAEDGTSAPRPSQPNPKAFNAFREMDKLRKGGVPQLAKIPDTVAVVGKPLNGFMGAKDSRDKKRKADDGDGDDDRDTKKEKKDVGVTFCHYQGWLADHVQAENTISFAFHDETLIYDGVTKTITNPEKLKYAENSAIKMVGRGPNADYKELKVGPQAPNRVYFALMSIGRGQESWFRTFHCVSSWCGIWCSCQTK
jgi:lupus La protein